MFASLANYNVDSLLLCRSSSRLRMLKCLWSTVMCHNCCLLFVIYSLHISFNLLFVTC